MSNVGKSTIDTSSDISLDDLVDSGQLPDGFLEQFSKLPENPEVNTAKPASVDVQQSEDTSRATNPEALTAAQMQENGEADKTPSTSNIVFPKVGELNPFSPSLLDNMPPAPGEIAAAQDLARSETPTPDFREAKPSEEGLILLENNAGYVFVYPDGRRLAVMPGVQGREHPINTELGIRNMEIMAIDPSPSEGDRAENVKTMTIRDVSTRKTAKVQMTLEELKRLLDVKIE